VAVGTGGGAGGAAAGAGVSGTTGFFLKKLNMDVR